jgi:hypothetical protein
MLSWNSQQNLLYARKTNQHKTLVLFYFPR